MKGFFCCSCYFYLSVTEGGKKALFHLEELNKQTHRDASESGVGGEPTGNG